MSTTQSIVGLVIFLVAGGGLRLFLENRAGEGTPLEKRFDVAALASLAHQLVLAGMDVRVAATQVTATIANPAKGSVTEGDFQRLTYLVAERVHQLQHP